MSDFITKDSGKRVTFPSGMMRDVSANKSKPHLVTSGPMLKRWAALMTRGAEKYGDDNWQKASGDEELQRARESVYRHFMQWWDGETDEDHAAAVFFNINLVEYIKCKSLTPSPATLPPLTPLRYTPLTPGSYTLPSGYAVEPVKLPVKSSNCCGAIPAPWILTLSPWS